MKKITPLLVLVCLLTVIAIINSCKKDPVIPTLTTATVTNITINSGTSGGVITKDGGAGVTARGVCWGIDTNPFIAGSHTTDDKGTGSFTSEITDLTPNTLYHVRAYATNSAGTAYGKDITFTTTSILVPTLTTITVTSITVSTAVSGGTITADGNGAITASGICWAITASPTISNDKTTDGTATGSFTSNLSGLQPGIIYYVRAYATNSAGTAYGNELSFTTIAPLGAPTIGTATKGNAQATVTFTAPASNGGSAITGYTVTSSPGGFTGTGSSSPIIVTGLTNGTAYTFTVIATNANGNSSPSSASNSVIPSTVPGAPTIGTATIGNTQATVTFTAPASNGGSAITGYTVTSSPGGFTGTGSSSPIIVTGLTNGTAYTFTVIATNANGNSSASSSSNSVTPSAVPGTPTIGTATKGNAQATVTFTAPASNGGSAITGYTVTSSPGGFTGTGPASPIIVTGLTNGTAYTFTIIATNANGNSAASSASNSVTPSTVPGAPTIGTATKGNAQASVTFTAPANNGGSAITGYTVTSSPGGFTGTGSSSPIIVTGLTNGTAYTFTVIATNANGNSLASSASNSVTPSTVSGAPTIGTAIKGNAQATVAFTAPVSNGGSAITGYTVTSSPGGFTGTGSSSPIIVTGLTNGTAYTFTVIATNANGNSLASSASNSVTPSTVPGAPTIGTATEGDAQASVTFTAPASNGGSAITGYTVTSSSGGLTGTGSSSPIIVTGLTNGTAYTFTVIATNASGSSLPSSASNSVRPHTPSTIYDVEGNLYNIVSIGTQVWMKEDLKTTKFNNGTVIPTTALDISNTTTYPTPVFQWPVDGSESNVAEYGRLYTFWVANNTHNVCPTGWHVPSDTELETLKTFLGGETVAGGKLKETGTTHWLTPNTGATNETGFTARGGGYRLPTGAFVSLNMSNYLWSNTVDNANLGWGQGMSYSSAALLRGGYTNNDAVSIRCLKN